MADIELVVKFEEFKFEALKNEEVYNTFPKEMKEWGLEAIRNGVPLPKRHGRLVDISEYEDNYFNTTITYDDGDHIYEKYTKMELPTVVEADREEKE